MKGNYFIAGLLLLLLIPSFVLSQNPEIKFNLIEGINGNPLGSINAITQDPKGYMWFSGTETNCLYRYDGTRMVAFGHDSVNGNSMSRQGMETVYADLNGMIWIGFYNGLDLYNPITNIFTHYHHDSKDPGSMDSGVVSAILRDHLGRLWIGTTFGLDLLDEKTGKFSHYKNDPDNPTSISSNVVRSLFEDRNGTLWIGCGFEFNTQSIFQYTSNSDGGLNRMEKDGSFTRFLHDPDNPNSLVNNKVRTIFEDSRGVLWIGTSGDGLHTMDLKNGIITRHLFNPEHPEWLSRPATKEGLTDPITFIREDANGGIWIGTYISGMNRYDTNTKVVTHFESSNGYPDKSSWAAYRSRDGVLWLSSTDQSNFLYRVEPLIHKLKNIPTKTIPNSFMGDEGGRLWMASIGEGLFEVDSSYQKIRKYKFNVSDSIDLTHSQNNLNSIFNIHGDTLWATSENGVLMFNKENNSLSRLGYKTAMDIQMKPLLGNILSAIRAKNGLFWFGSLDGLMQYDPGNQILKKYDRDIHDSNALVLNYIRSIMEDDSGDIWAGTSNDLFFPITGFVPGLIRLNAANGKFRNYLRGLSLTCLYKDGGGTIWAGTLTGLYQYNQKEDLFTRFFKTLLVRGGENIVSIIEDNLRNLWVVTNSSIIRLDPERKNYFVYGEKYGIRPTTLGFGGICKTSKGEILIGNNNGFYILSPQEMMETSPPLKILITDFFIDNLKVLPKALSSSGKAIDETDDLYLKYNENNFSLNFSAIDYRAPETNIYYTMLENYDSTWRQAAGDKSAYYINIPPGKYIFRVRVVNSDGIQAEKSVQILINPPWWKTWPAYIFYALLFFIFAFFMNRMLRRRAIQAERQKAQVKELAQAKQIEKAYSELKSTQAQLIQSEKMASLGELTAGIAHEIQNPLNFVNNFSEVNKELITEMKAELLAGNQREAISLADNIEGNEEKINLHGKRADAIVKGMLQHSRSSNGIKEPTDINVLAEEYLRLSYHGLRAKEKGFNSTMKTAFDNTIGVIQIIPPDIGRVLLNLYNNAFYFVAKKKKQQLEGYEPVVSVSTKKINGMVEIRVKDNGNGIPQKVIDKIFQPFFTTKPTGQGTGLGLSLSYDIVKAHGGEIKVESKEGEYSEFIVILPC